MSIKKSDYEIALAYLTSRSSTVNLLGQYRQYLEMIPSMRRPQESIVVIPLPLAKVRNLTQVVGDTINLAGVDETIPIPCDIAVLMCDPEWKIKMGVEILVFIHRPQEDFSDLLRRWRQTQVYLHKEYEWIMPEKEGHMFSDMPEQIHPLFIIFPHSLPRIKKGLESSSLPYIEYVPELSKEEKEHLETVNN